MEIRPSGSIAVDQAFTYLVHGHASGRLAHAYIVRGAPRGDGLRLAKRMLQRLFCPNPDPPCGACPDCRRIAEQRHPDVAWLEPQGKGRALSVDQIRELCSRLARTSFGGGWKAAVLIHAERMNQAAANAFLKTLEEPPPRSILFLLTEHPAFLLPTIRSRCQRISLHDGARRPDGGWIPELLALLRDGPPADPVDALTRAAGTARLLTALTKEISDEEKEAASGAEGLDEDILDARVRSRVREIQEDIVKAMQCWHRDILVLAAGAAEPALYYPEEADRLRDLAAGHTWNSALTSLQTIDQAARKLDLNLPPLVVFETMFVEQGRAAQRSA